MNASTSTLGALCALTILLPLGMPPVARADGDSTPLIVKVHNATARYVDINAAFAEGFVTATPCVSGPDTGAMGVHLVLPSRLNAGVLNAAKPEALIYEPMANGAMRLVGVEFIVLASVWATNNPGGGVPAQMMADSVSVFPQQLGKRIEKRQVRFPRTVLLDGATGRNAQVRMNAANRIHEFFGQR